MKNSTVIKSVFFFSCVVLIVLLFCPPVFCGVRGKVKGQVTGTDGKPIPDVNITMQSLKVTTEIYEIKTDEGGNFVYVGLKPFKYKVTFAKEGYQSIIEPEFKVRAGPWVELNPVMYTMKELQEEAFENQTPAEKAAVRFNEGTDLFGMNDFDNAIVKLNEAVGFNPDLYRAHFLLGIIYFTKKQDYVNAKTTFEGALEADPEAPTPYEYLGAIADNSNDTEKAKSYWEKYFELDGDSGVVAENLAVIYLEVNDYVNARRILEKGIEVEPEFSALFKKLGDVCMRLADYPCAVGAFEKYLELEPEAPDKNVVTIYITELSKAIKKSDKEPKKKEAEQGSSE